MCLVGVSLEWICAKIYSARVNGTNTARQSDIKQRSWKQINGGLSALDKKIPVETDHMSVADS